MSVLSRITGGVIFLFIVLSFITAYIPDSPCYQESANETNQVGTDGNCDLIYTGTYGTNENSYLYINYTKPLEAQATSKWAVKFGSTENDSAHPIFENATIPSDCWDYNSNTLVLRLRSEKITSGGDNIFADGECFNGTGWTMITSFSAGQIESKSDSPSSITNIFDGNWATGTWNWYSWWSTAGDTEGHQLYYGMLYEEAMIWDMIDNCTYNPINSSWSAEWQNISCLLDDKMNQSKIMTEYDSNYGTCYDVTKLTSDLWNSGNNNTYFQFQAIESCDNCTSNWQEINTTCNSNDEFTGYYTDTNNCFSQTGLANDNLPPANNSYVCDFCAPVLTNTTWNSWADTTCSLTQMNQSSFLTQYDSQNCYASTGLASDNVTNTTIFKYQLIGPNLINTTFGAWTNITACLLGDYYTQEQNLTQYDTYSCTANTTIFDYQNLTCDFCTPSLANQTSAWTNSSCLPNDKMNQTKTITEYDMNSCEEISNQTFSEYQAIETCDFCTPNMTYTDWSSWSDLTCSSNQMNQSQFRINYDINSCGEIANTTEYNYQLVGPDLQNTTWSSWTNVSCISGDVMNQSRNNTQYDIYGCTVNQTNIEYQINGTCDFCTPNWVNISYTDWTNTTNCNMNNTVNETREITQNDTNSCGEGTYSSSSLKIFKAIESSSFNNRVLTETKTGSCDYCSPTWVCNNYDLNGNCIDCLDANFCYNQTQHSSDNYTNATLSNLTINITTDPIQNVTDALNGTTADNATITNSTFNSSTVPSMNIEIERYDITQWKTLTGLLDVTLEHGNEKVAEFTYNFTNHSIDFHNISLEQSSQVKGYVFLRGLNTEFLFGATKTLYLNNLDTTMNWVCVKDAEIWNINEITSNCQGSYEHHVQCNGQLYDSQYTCIYNSTLDQYKITGLKHSGVIQSSAPANTTTTTTTTTTTSSSSSGSTGNSKVVTTIRVIPSASDLAELAANKNQQNSPISLVTGAAIGVSGNNSYWVAVGFVVIIIAGFIALKMRKTRKK